MKIHLAILLTQQYDLACRADWKMVLLVIVLLMLNSVIKTLQYKTRGQGFTSDVIENHRYVCNYSKMLSYTTESQIQCVGRCSVQKDCSTLNFMEKVENHQKNCEIFLQHDPQQSCHVVATKNDWLGMKFKRIEDQEIRNGEERVYASCKDIFDRGKGLADGVYDLVPGKHYCVFSPLGECGGGGWTLAMKINGSEDTFKSDSAYWRDNVVYRVEEGLKDPVTVEAKYPAFSTIGFQSICIGMTYDNITEWILINKSESSLRDVFKNNRYSMTRFGVEKWKSFINGGCLQPHCNKEGFNAGKGSNKIYARIGVVSNKKVGGGNECNKIQSYIGIGTRLVDENGCLSTNRGVSCGNFVMCNDGNCERSVPGIGTILIK